MKLFFLFPFMLCMVVFSGSVLGQSADSNNVAYQEAVNIYHRSLSPETGLYNGIAYVDYAYSIQEGTPFFDVIPFGKGTVVFYDMFYPNVSIAYDEVKGEVVIYDASHFYKMILNKNGVSRFTTSGQPFIHLTKDSAGSGEMSAGFYEILYDGKTRVLKRETRNVQESLATNGLSKKYILSSADFYVWKDNVYHSVNNKAVLLSLLDKQKSLQHWLKKNKLKFSRDKDETLAKAAAWYDDQSKQNQ